MKSMYRKRRILMTASGTLALNALAGCATQGLALARLAGDQNSAQDAAQNTAQDAAQNTAQNTAQDNDELKGYDKFQHSNGSINHAVFVSRGVTGPGVIIMHELTGLHKPTKDFADWLVERGYRVYLPQLFGPVMTRQPVRNIVRICIKHEIYLFSRGRSSPITSWLRSLAQVVRAESGGTGIGVVGMCLTGGFVIPLIVDDSVVAGVAAQPSLPILASDRLGVDRETLNQATHLTDDEILSLRFSGDTVSPLSRHLRIAEVMCGAEKGHYQKSDGQRDGRFCDDYELLEVPGEGHSTLTSDYSRALSRGVDTRGKVLSLFDRKLKQQWSTAMSDSDEER